MDLPTLMRQLDARIIASVDYALFGACPTCGARTERAWNGQNAYCLPCTELEVQEEAPLMAARISRKMTRKAYYSLPRDADGRPILPTLTSKQWYKLGK